MSLTNTIEFITDSATETDIDRVIDAINVRRTALRARAAAAVTVGMATRIEGIKPNSLSGLTGTVTRIEGNRATVRLDAASTRVARYKGARRFYIPADTTEYEMSGIPLSCCKAR